jgi:hypothetical protein
LRKCRTTWRTTCGIIQISGRNDILIYSLGAIKYEDKPIRILVIEDSDEDFKMFMRAVKSYKGSFSIDRCTDGDTAWEFLFNEEE